MTLHKHLALIAALFVSASPLRATTWTHTTNADFNAGSSDGEVDVVSSGDGAVRLAKLAGSLGSFQSVTPLPGTMDNYSSWTYGSRMYVAGGYLNGVHTANIYSNDLDSSGNFSAAWTLQGTLPSQYLASGAARWMNHLYLGGGDTGALTGISTNLVMANLDSSGIPGSWQNVGPLPVDEADGHFIAAQGKLFYFAASGTVNAGGTYARTNVYAAPILGDGTLGAWSLVNSRPAPFRLFSTNYVADRAVLAGGENSGYFGTTNVYGSDIGTQGTLSAWSSDTALPQPRSYFIGAEGDGAGKLFIVGGKTGSSFPGNTWSTVYSAPFGVSGTVGAWSAENSLPQGVMSGSWAVLGGKLHSFGGAQYPSNVLAAVYSASLNQGTTNAAAGSFAGHFDLGSVISLGTLEWICNDLAHVALQARVGDSSGNFGAWTALNNSGVINLYSVAATGRYVEYRAKLTDNGTGDVELDSVTLRDLADLSATPTPTQTQTPTLSPTCPSLPSYSGPGNLGDILITMLELTSVIRMDSSSGGSFYPFASLADTHIHDITVDYDDNSKVRISRNDNHDVVLVDASGAIVPGQTWTLPVGTAPCLGAFDPISGDFYVPDAANGGIWWVKHGSSTPVMLPGSNTLYHAPINAVFDSSGNLYIVDSLNGAVRKYSASDLAAWSSSSVTPNATLYANIGLELTGMAYDGAGRLYVMAVDGANQMLFYTVLMGPSSGSFSSVQPVWPALSGVPAGIIGNRLSSSYDLVVDLSGKLWMVCNGVSDGMYGIARMDTNGTILDWRSTATQTGLPGGIALAGLRSPQGYRYPGCQPTATPSATPTRSATPTLSATPSLTPAATSSCGLSVGSYSGIGKAGDVLVSLRLSGGVVAGLDSSPNGAYYNYASISDAHLDGLTTDFDDNSLIRASREDNHDVVELDASGNIVAGQTWTFPVGVTPKIGAFNPVAGDFYVPDQAGNGIWVVKHGTTTPLLLPNSASYFTQPLCTTFDNSGNLYIADTLGQKVWKYSAASLAAWSASSTTPVPTLYDFLAVNIGGLVYDGGNHLYGVAATSSTQLVDILMGASSGTATGIPLTWPALPNVPPAQVGQHPSSPDGLIMDLDGNLWAVEAGSTMRGIYKMDIHGTILDWRPLTIAGTPDDLALAGLRLPHGPISCLSFTPSPTFTSTLTSTPVIGTPTFSGTSTGSPTPSGTQTATASASPTQTQTATPSRTVTAVSTATDSATATASPSRTATATFSATATPSPTASRSTTPSSTVTASGLTPFVTHTPTLSPTRTPTQTPGGGTAIATVTPLPSHTCIALPAPPGGIGDGPQKVVVCSQDGGHCKVRVFRPEGRVCNRLWEGEMNPNETKVLFWNHDDDDGQEMASGIYIVVFQDGNGSLHKSKCAIIR